MSENQKVVSINPVDRDIFVRLERTKSQLSKILPPNLTPDRFVRIAYQCYRSNEKLRTCDPGSFIASVVTSAQLGLELGSSLGHAWIVPYQGKAQLQIGYKGMIKLARNGNYITDICAHPVCANDKFDFAFGLNERLEHIPAVNDRGEVVCYYAIAKFKDGGHHIEIMGVKEVEQIRDLYSQTWKYATTQKQKDDSTWGKSPLEMGRKTVVKRLSKYIPLDPLAQKAIEIDNAVDAGSVAYLDEHGDVVIDQVAKETTEPKQVENKPRNMDEFIAKVATPAPEPLARKEETIVKEEPVIVKPEQKVASANFKVWEKLSNSIIMAINEAKTSEEINRLINSTHKVTLTDMQKIQPDFYNKIMDCAMDMQSALAQTP